MVNFNQNDPSIMYVDVNSCFASVEQLYNPLLIGKPVVVAAYKTERGCILAASREAKKMGIKTGNLVYEARKLCPSVTVLECDPPKYRIIHHKLKSILENYTENVIAKSIDEFVMDLTGYPAFRNGMIKTAKEIKSRIKKEIGECLTVSIGISTNRYLAKVASDYEKPDGLTIIDKNNYEKIFASLKLIDLCGIKKRTEIRLHSVGINSVMEMYSSSIQKLKSAYSSVCGYYWFMRLHGYEIDDVTSPRKSFGNQYVLPCVMEKMQALPILQKLVEKMGKRLRDGKYVARGIHLGIRYDDYSYFHHGENIENLIFSSKELYARILNIFKSFPEKKVREISVGCFNLSTLTNIQEELFNNPKRELNLYRAIDRINNRFGDLTLMPAAMLFAKDNVCDRIAFGR